MSQRYPNGAVLATGNGYGLVLLVIIKSYGENEFETSPSIQIGQFLEQDTAI